MGWQVRPDLSGPQMCGLLIQSSYTTLNGHKIIDPQAFIALVKQASENPAAL
jgi:hypothetical protein